MNDLNTMVTIQEQAKADHSVTAPLPLNEETKALAEGKRFTFDVIQTPVDPLR